MPGYELIGQEEKKAVIDVFEKGGGILNRYGFNAVRNNSFKVVEFEKKFAEYMNAKYAQAVTSGSVALKVALIALGIKPGDEVITQSFTFVATAEAILEVGAIPIFTEVDETLTMDVEDLKKKITLKTKAIIPVHMYGFPCNMDGIMKIAREYNLKVLEDTAQACGGEYKGKKLGTIGDVGIFSFDFGKTITTGEGSMIITNDEEIYKKCKEFSDHGHEDNPNFPRGEDTRRMRGFTHRMMELQGAIGLVQLSKLNYSLSKQEENKKKIMDRIKINNRIEFNKFHYEEGETKDSLIFFMKDKETAEKAVSILKEEGIGTKNLPDAFKWHFVGTWDHMLSSLDYYNGEDLMKLWPKSANLLERAISLAINIKMSEEDISKITNAINRLIKEC